MHYEKRLEEHGFCDTHNLQANFFKWRPRMSNRRDQRILFRHDARKCRLYTQAIKAYYRRRALPKAMGNTSWKRPGMSDHRLDSVRISHAASRAGMK